MTTKKTNRNPYDPPKETADESPKTKRASKSFELVLFGGMACMVGGVTVGTVFPSTASNLAVWLFFGGILALTVALR